VYFARAKERLNPCRVDTDVRLGNQFASHLKMQLSALGDFNHLFPALKCGEKIVRVRNETHFSNKEIFQRDLSK